MVSTGEFLLNSERVCIIPVQKSILTPYVQTSTTSSRTIPTVWWADIDKVALARREEAVEPCGDDRFFEDWHT